MSAGWLLGWGFVNGALLGATGLVALPIIIHWLSRRRFKRVRWAAMRFLLEADRENRRRRQLEQWLLLALRCLAMLLLALLMARPFLEPGALAALLGGAGNVRRVIVLDDSGSLRYQRGGRADFAAAVERTQRLVAWIAEADPGSPLTILRTSEPDAVWLESDQLAVADVPAIRERLADLTPTPLRANPRPLIERVATDIDPAAALTRTDVFLISDFQASDWLGSQRERLFEPLQSFADGQVRVVLLPTSSAPRGNLALTALELERDYAIAGQPAQLYATVHNFAATPTAALQLELTAGDQTLPPVQVAPLAAGERRSEPVETTLADPGLVPLLVRVSAADGLALDDARRLVVAVKPTVRLLLVNGAPAADPRADEVYLARRALAPPGPLASGIQIEVVDPEEVSGTDLQQYDCVFLANVPLLTGEALAALKRFVADGGGLAVFLGDRIQDPTAFNSLFYENGRGLLPVALERVSGAGEPAGLIAVQAHPVTSIFPAEGAGLAEYVQFRRFFRLAPGATAAAPQTADAANAATPGVRALARFTDAERSLALVEKQFGRGRVLLFASSLDQAWNNWAAAIDGSYVVTLLEMARYLARVTPHPPAFDAGDTLSLPLSLQRYEPEVVFRPPLGGDGAPQRALAETIEGAGLAIARGPVARRLGVYQAELAPRGGALRTRPLCVNLAPAESDLASADRAALAAALTGVEHVFADAESAYAGAGADVRRELWRSVLNALVVVLLAEQILAWWFGRIDRSGATVRRPVTT